MQEKPSGRLKWYKKSSVHLWGMAFIVGVLAIGSVMHYVQQERMRIQAQWTPKMTVRLVAAEDLPKGTVLQTAQLALRDVPERYVPSTSLDENQLDLVLGKTLSVDLKRGDLISLSDLQLKNTKAPFSHKIAVGRRAFTLLLHFVSSVSDWVEPGDHIDLFVSFEYRNQHVTAPLLQGVLVMAAPSDQQVEEGDRNSATVTLDLSPEQAARLVAAQSAGEITALLRNPEDHEVVHKGVQGSLAKILGIASAPIRKNPQKPPIIYADKASEADLRALQSSGIAEASAGQEGEGAQTSVQGASVSTFHPALGDLDLPEALVQQWIQTLKAQAGGQS